MGRTRKTATRREHHGRRRQEHPRDHSARTAWRVLRRCRRQHRKPTVPRSRNRWGLRCLPNCSSKICERQCSCCRRSRLIHKRRNSRLTWPTLDLRRWIPGNLRDVGFSRRIIGGVGGIPVCRILAQISICKIGTADGNSERCAGPGVHPNASILGIRGRCAAPRGATGRALIARGDEDRCSFRHAGLEHGADRSVHGRAGIHFAIAIADAYDRRRISGY